MIIEDDTDLAEMMGVHLADAGWTWQQHAEGQRGLDALHSETPALVILDLMLPDMSGFEVLKEIRRHGVHPPVVILSARTDEIDRVLALELGADDYVTKPFSSRELMIRIRKLVQRARNLDPGPSPNEAAPIREYLACEDLKVDIPGHRVTIQNRSVRLTAKEYQLLVCLMNGRGRVFSRERILECVWRDEGKVGLRTVDTHILRLREKLGKYANHLETVRGVGYRFLE